VTPARSSYPAALAKDINLGEIGMSADKAELLQSLRIERSEIGMAADKGELLHSLRIGIFPSIRAARMRILAGLYGR
jgi:hypothetical protein